MGVHVFPMWTPLPTPSPCHPSGSKAMILNFITKDRGNPLVQILLNYSNIYPKYIFAGDLGWFLGWEDTLEKGMATHSSILAWRIPLTEKPGELPSTGSQRVGHDWATNTFSFTYIHPREFPHCSTDNNTHSTHFLVQNNFAHLPYSTFRTHSFLTPKKFFLSFYSTLNLFFPKLS